jgi:hypothetical protein
MPLICRRRAPSESTKNQLEGSEALLIVDRLFVLISAKIKLEPHEAAPTGISFIF